LAEELWVLVFEKICGICGIRFICDSDKRVTRRSVAMRFFILRVVEIWYVPGKDAKDNAAKLEK